MPTAPTLINLPPPPSDPVTPSDIPGTPNSGTTSMSELSTVAIKDGHRGHLPHHSNQIPQPASSNLDAERADRISRLAGLERVATARNPTPLGNLTPGASVPPGGGSSGYFDNSGNPVMGRERSTVGSASATGSVGGRTTWASGSDSFDPDKMSESQDMDMDTNSVEGMSDEGTGSLVAFGEGARTPARHSAYGSPSASKATPVGAPLPFGGRDTSLTSVHAQSAADSHDSRMLDGSTYGQNNTEASGQARTRGAASKAAGAEAAERILRERLGPSNANGKVMDSPETGAQGGKVLGKFEFEEK